MSWRNILHGKNIGTFDWMATLLEWKEELLLTNSTALIHQLSYFSLGTLPDPCLDSYFHICFKLSLEYILFNCLSLSCNYL
jgi:hypothetical protein